jgi:hypothetical protein
MPQLRPNIISYSLVLKAWAGSADPQALERMWSIYELIHKEGIEIDIMFGSHLIFCLSLGAVSLHSDLP